MKREIVDDKFIINHFELGKSEIQEIIPHKGRMLFLDSVIAVDGMVVGNFLITQEVCEGHKVFEGQLVFKGSDIYDMAAQVLGVFVAKTLNFSGDYEHCLVKSYGRAFFYKPVFVGETLSVRIDYNKIETIVLRGKGMIIVTGRDFLVSSRTENKARIEYVKIVIY